MRIVKVLALCFSVLPTLVFSNAAFAQGLNLRVTPVSINAEAPVSSGKLTLSNSGDRPLRVQVRVFEWVQRNGKNMYIPTKNVAVSPPMMTMRPGSDSVLRVVRVGKKPLAGQETYRVIIDQLPDASVTKTGKQAVSFVIRHSIPVVFSAKGDFNSRVKWSAKRVGKSYQLTAVNNGNAYERISDIKLMAGNKVAGSTKGLAGYVLPGSTMTFSVPVTGGGVPTRISAKGAGNAPFNEAVR